jgi:hypothetical protein
MIRKARQLTVSAALFAAVVSLTAAPLAAAEPNDRPASSAIESMKRAYLDCERAATAGTLDAARIGHCSGLYETLKAEAFGGSFGALKRWYDLQSTGPAGQGV